MVKKFDAEKPLTKAQQRQAATGKKGASKPRKVMIPTLPNNPISVEELEKPTQRAVACVNLKLCGASFQAIADELGYKSAREAETAYISALANMHPVESAETLRQTEALRAEMGIRLAAAMMSADYLVDADDPTVKIPNPDKRLWHDQYLKAVALHSTITGAKAPARVEVSVDVAELNQMAQDIIQHAGGQLAIEASMWDADEVIELDVLPERGADD